MKGFKDRLKDLMELNGMSNYKLAKATGFSPSTIANWLSGETTPDSTKLEVVGLHLGCNADWLLTGNGYMTNSQIPKIETEQDLAIQLRLDIIQIIMDNKILIKDISNKFNLEENLVYSAIYNIEDEGDIELLNDILGYLKGNSGGKSVNERIRIIANSLYNGDFTKMCEVIGTSRAAMSHIVDGRMIAPPFDVINSLVGKLGISADWLITGKGSMLKSESEPMVSYSTGRPYYNVDFIGGFDLILNDQSINPEYNIDFAPYNKDGVMWCNITGRSMEPEISSGDTMAIKEVQDWDKYLTMNETYAIVTKNDLRTVKKIRKGSSNDHLTLVPVNKEYDEQEIAKEMILRVFLVLGCMKRF